MKIMGVHEGHNASVCLLEDGIIKWCIQEERLRREKNYTGFPSQAVEFILKVENLSPHDIDYLAMAGLHVAKPFDLKEHLNLYRKDSQMKGKVKNLLKYTPIYTVYKQKRKEDRLKSIKNVGFKESQLVFVDHHLCHASAAYFGSPWRDEKVLVVTNDGSGDGLCSTVYTGEKGVLTKIVETPKGHSIGNIYSRTTFMMGMIPLEHEYKLMGMAPYASEERRMQYYETYSKYLDLDAANPLAFKRKIKEPTFMIYPRLKKDFELVRFDNIAAGIQHFTEELMTKWIKECVKKTKIKNIAAAGGTFMNVKANKKILELDDVEKFFVFPSCGDDSNSIGAAFHVYAEKTRESGGDVKIPPLGPLFFGPDVKDDEIQKAVNARKNEINSEKCDDISKRAGELIADGKIVARCSGRMEFGARALGNRSILANASDFGVVKTINQMIKKRDFWMPFAPVILKERETDYVVNPKKMPFQYMIFAADSTEKREEIIGGVQPADNSIRPQIIEKDWNPEYYNILKSYENQTGVGGMLNTSFNIHGYPIVCNAEDALWTFENSGLEYLVLGDYLVTKK